jgi:hypothetical protein
MERYALAYLLSVNHFHVDSQLFLNYLNEHQILTQTFSIIFSHSFLIEIVANFHLIMKIHLNMIIHQDLILIWPLVVYMNRSITTCEPSVD